MFVIFAGSDWEQGGRFGRTCHVRAEIPRNKKA